MFGPKLTSLFKNRWMALLWSVSIIWMAVTFVGTDNSTRQDDQATTRQDMAALDKFFANE